MIIVYHVQFVQHYGSQVTNFSVLDGRVYKRVGLQSLIIRTRPRCSETTAERLAFSIVQTAISKSAQVDFSLLPP